MCNLYQMTSSPDAMRRLFAVEELPNFPPSYRIAPTDPAPIIRLTRDGDGDEGARELAVARWSLVPRWSKTPTLKYATFNARGEELAEKPTFREAYRRRRCLVPADGFYERLPQPDGSKQYYRIFVTDGEKVSLPFAFAGLWELWRSPDGGETRLTFTIVTTQANPLVAELHPKQRMPIVLSPEDYETWLREGDQAIERLLTPFPAERMQAVPIASKVGSPKCDAADPDLIAPTGPAYGLRADTAPAEAPDLFG